MSKVKCHCCKQEMDATPYDLLCAAIMQHYLVCSRKCNVKLGQARAYNNDQEIKSCCRIGFEYAKTTGADAFNHPGDCE